MRERDRQLAAAFDGLRRSTAILQFTIQRHDGLITDEEFARFTPEMRARVSGAGR